MSTITSRHGRYLCTEVEQDPAIVVADRGEAGPWEQFALEPVDREHVALKAINGRYLTAEVTGRVVARGESVHAWQTWRVHRDGSRMAFESGNDRAPGHLTAEEDGTVTVRSATRDAWQWWEVRGAGSGAPPATGDRLHLPVVVTPRGWGDQGGYRPLLFASWFPMLRILRDDAGRFTRTLDLLHGWGVHGIRAFIDVRHPAYWGGREVQHEWPDFASLCQTAAEALQARGMAWFVTAGDLQLIADEQAPYRAAASALRNYLDVVAVVDVNEGWQNSSARDDNPEHFAKLVKPFADLGVAWATSCPFSEEDVHTGKMWRSVQAPVATIHGPGGRELMVRHIVNHQMEGWNFKVAGMQGEPRGPGEDVSAGRVNETGWVVLAAVAAGMTGQMYVLHCSRGIRDRDNDDAWEVFAPYFQRSAAMLAHIPRSRVMAVGHGGRGGTHPEALFASTRSDGAFSGDREEIRGEFHRCDAVRYESGERACLLYGGVGERGAKAVRAVTGRFVNTHGQVVHEAALAAGEILRVSGEVAGDGLLFVGR